LEPYASHESNTVIIILKIRSCHITYPMLSLTMCVSSPDKRYNHTSAGRVTKSYPACTTLVQASWNEDDQTYLRTVACLAQSYEKIQFPPSWSAGQPQEESTKKNHNRVSTQHSQASSHKSTQTFCSTAQQQRPTALPGGARRPSDASARPLDRTRVTRNISIGGSDQSP